MIKYLVIIAAVAAGLYFFTSCMSSSEDVTYEETLKKGQEYLEANAKRKEVTTTASGLQYEILTEGKEGGKSPKATDLVRCHYEGRLIDGKVFDSSYKSGSPLVFGLDQVISGWTEGLQYMKEGAKYRFVIPYQLGYGASGVGPIPPYSTLIFEVELIEVL